MMKVYGDQHPRVQRRQVRAKTARVERMPLVGGIILLLLLALSLPSRAGVPTPQQLRQAQDIATLGSRHATHETIFQEGMRAYERGDYHLARRLWYSLAVDGHRDAQFHMGMLYDMGRGVAVDPRQSVSWYQRAALAGHRNAQHNLGVAYAEGVGVEMDIHEALQWWSRSAQQGNTDAQYNLGVIYAIGRDDVIPNVVKALKWWRMAAVNGDALAQYNLGTLYANGDATVRNYCEAVRWWEKSAQGGVTQAEIALQLIMVRDDFTGCR
jgi:TPR repeat protein